MTIEHLVVNQDHSKHGVSAVMAEPSVGSVSPLVPRWRCLISDWWFVDRYIYYAHDTRSEDFIEVVKCGSFIWKGAPKSWRFAQKQKARVQSMNVNGSAHTETMCSNIRFNAESLVVTATREAN